MKAKRLLAAFLLAVGLCLVPALGYGEIPKRWYYETKVPLMDLYLLQARVSYAAARVYNSLYAELYYDPDGMFENFFPEGVDTTDKIFVQLFTNRPRYLGVSERTLLELFRKDLEDIYWFIEMRGVSTDMNADIVATLDDMDGVHLAYFYEGEYHLWRE